MLARPYFNKDRTRDAYGYPIGFFHCHAIKNQIANHSIQKVQNLGNKRRQIYKRTRQESGLCDISYARYSEKRFTQIYKALYGDAMFVSLSGAQIWPPETNRNICFWVFLQMREFIAWKTHKGLKWYLFRFNKCLDSKSPKTGNVFNPLKSLPGRQLNAARHAKA